MELFGARLHESPERVDRARSPGSRRSSRGPRHSRSRHRRGPGDCLGHAGEDSVRGRQWRESRPASSDRWWALRRSAQIRQYLGDYPDAIYRLHRRLAVTLPASHSRSWATTPPPHPRPRLVAAEPVACPKITRGRLAYTKTDFSGTTPIARMMTLGCDYEAPGIHAGGLRYHGTSPFLSEMYRERSLRRRCLPAAESLQVRHPLCPDRGRPGRARVRPRHLRCGRGSSARRKGRHASC